MAEYDGIVLVNTALEDEGFRKGSKRLQSAVKSLHTQLEKLRPILDSAVSGNAKAMVSFKSKAADAEDKVKSLRQELVELSNTPVKSNAMKTLEKELDSVAKKIAATKKKYSNAEAGLLEYQEERNAIRSGSREMMSQATTDEQRSNVKQFEDEQIAALNQKYAEQISLVDRLNAELSELEQKQEALNLQMGEAKATASIDRARHIHELKNEIDDATNELVRMKEEAGKASGAVASIKAAAKKIPGFLRKAAAATKKLITANRSYKNSFSGVLAQIKRIAPALLAAEGVLGMLRKAVNAYMESNQQLASTLNSCWAGIGNLLGPIISRIIGLIASAVAYFTAFLRLLGFTGGAAVKAIGGAGGAAKKETDKLKRQLASFDDLNILSDTSSDDSGGGGGGGADAALPEKQLPDWAKLMAEQLKAGDWKGAAITLTDKLNEMVENTDWEGAGRKIGYYMDGVLSFLATAITSFNWPALGVGLATAANQILEAVDWTNLGIVLGAGLLAALGLLYGFVSTFDWAALGKAIADAVMGLWTAIDWNMAAQTVSMGIIGVLTTLITAIQNFDWQQIGRDVATFLTGINWGEIFSNLGKLLWEALKAAFEFLGGMIEGGGLGILASAFALLAGGLASKVAAGAMWGSVKKALTEAVKKLLKGVVGAEGIGAWGTKILAAGKTMLGTLVGKIGGIAAKVLPAIGGTLTKIVTGIVAAIGGWPALLIVAGAAAITALVVWLRNGGSEVIQGFIDGAKEKLGALKQTLNDTWSDIRSAAGNSWGEIKSTIGDTWSDLKIKSSQKWSDIKSTVEKAWSDIQKSTKISNKEIKSVTSSVWTDVKKNITTKLSEAKTAADGHWENIKSKTTSSGAAIGQTVANRWQEVRSSITSYLGNARDEAASIWDTIKSKTETVGPQIVSSVVTAWSDVKSKITEQLGNARDSTVAIWQNMSSRASEIHGGIKSSLSGIWADIKTTLTQKAGDIASGITAKFDELKTEAFTWGRHICENIQAGIDAFNYKVRDAAKRLGQKIKDFVGFSEPKKGPLSNFHTYMPDMIDLMVEGIEGNQNRAVKAVAAMARDMSDEIQSADYGIKPIVNTRGLSQLKALAASPTYRTPAIAKGELLPYQVTAKLMGGNDGVIDAVRHASDALCYTFTSVIKEAVMAVITAIQQSGGNAETVDSETMTTLIINEINRRTRSMGTSPLL